MKDIQMLEYLLNKTGRMYDKIKLEDKIIIQVHSFDGRTEFDFDIDGNLEEDWDNSAITTWISEGAYKYY